MLQPSVPHGFNHSQLSGESTNYPTITLRLFSAPSFSKVLNCFFFLKLTDKFSFKKKSDKIMRLYILILMCSGTSREDTIVETGWWQLFHGYIFS